MRSIATCVSAAAIATAIMITSQALAQQQSGQGQAGPMVHPEEQPAAQPSGAQVAPAPQAAPVTPPPAAPAATTDRFPDPLISPDPLQPVFQPWYDLKADAKDKLDLKIDPSYTFLYQYADKVVVDSKYDVFQGRLDLPADWVLLKDGKNTGSIGFLMRSGENIFSAQDFNLPTSAGDTQVSNALQGGGPQTNISVNLLYWRQSFLDDKLAFYIGKIHPNQHIDLDPFNNDETSQFLALPFDGNTSNPQLGNYSEGAAVEWQFTDIFYVHALVMSSSGGPALPPSNAFKGYYYEAAEIGAKPTIEGLGKGNYRLSGWYDHANQDGWGGGVSVGFSQEIGQGWAPFGRWGYGDQTVTTTTQMLSGGIANVTPFGRRSDMFGIGLAWGDPASSTGQRQQTMLETFYRLKLTDTLEFSPDVQILMPPGDPAANNPVIILNARLKVVF